MKPTLTAIQIEGNLLAPDMTSLLQTGSIKGQAPEDFGFAKTDKLADEIATAWGDAKAYWTAFQRALERLATDDLTDVTDELTVGYRDRASVISATKSVASATSITREMWAVPLLRSLGFNPVYTAKAEVVEGQTYAISHRAAKPNDSSITNYELRITNYYPPIHIIGCRVKVDQRPPSGIPRLSAHALVQEYLNKTEHLWAIATNGFRWRLLRDSSLMTRLTYIEFDLEQILHGENFAEFGLFYRLFHRSRLPEGVDDADKCLLEYYHQEALQRGGRVRDKLRDGVEAALIQLGNGFLQHPQNEHLRQKLGNGEWGVGSREWGERTSSCTSSSFYRQLLRLIYRLLFLMVAESRNLLFMENGVSEIKSHESGSSPTPHSCKGGVTPPLLATPHSLLPTPHLAEKARIYREYYSIERLRELAERPNYRREGFQDLWQGLWVTFLLFDENWRGELLGLSPLNGDLFGSNTLPDLAGCAIDNHDLMVAIRHLSLYQDKGQLRRVNYAALDVEELGSVYESLLDFHPQIMQRQGIYELALVFGSDRKTTGSYYTPPQLVQQLIKTALEPVIEAKLATHLAADVVTDVTDDLTVGFTDQASTISATKSAAKDLTVGFTDQASATKSAANDLTVGFTGQASATSATKSAANDLTVGFTDQASATKSAANDLTVGFTDQASATSATKSAAKDLTVGFTDQASATSATKSAANDLTVGTDQASARKSAANNLTVGFTDQASATSATKSAAKEAALLSLKIVDPACGSGHFLLAAARRIGKELARIRTGEAEPGQEPLRQAIRDVVQNCIYGVDINPLAVDLCKVALWIEGFSRGFPLNFLDHRIKCGNSLVGVLDLDCLNEGIPDEAFKAVTGDDKQLSTQFKKRNKKERENKGQLSVFGDIEGDRAQYAESWRELGLTPETTAQKVKEKAKQYKDIRDKDKNQGWWRDYSACNLWTAAFFMPLSEQNLQLLPTTEALNRLLREPLSPLPTPYSPLPIIEAANKLAEEKRFFHWCLEFPEVFETGGFDCVLGNPPWERIKLQEKEFFASRSADIANAANKAAREKLIQELPKKNLELAQAWEEAKHDAEAQSKFIRESARFPLTAVGDINTYAVFAETTRKLVSPDGRVGVIVPTGIATDDTCKKFFRDLAQKQALASLYDFENREGLFSAVHRSYKFSLLAITGKPIKQGNFAFFLTQVRQLDNSRRQFQLSPQDIALLNPNTLTCPVFRSSVDAELTKKIYQRVPVLENEQTGRNPWGISFMRMFDMANDSGLFKNEAGDGLVPLYEAKMFHQFTHRWATYSESGDTRDLTDLEKGDPSFAVQPRYWVSRGEVENKLGDKWKQNWLLAFRSICRSTDERTSIFSLLPKFAVGHKAPLVFIDKKYVTSISCLLANLNSLVFDFVTRQKLGGTDFSFFILKQLPVLPPEAYTPEDIEFISNRVLELVYTAWDMQPFAKDMGYEGEPFTWNSNRRALLRAELDAYYAKLYGLTRDELRYILDPADVYGKDFPSETFRVLKNNEVKQFGEYRTQRLVLEVWDGIIRNS